MRILQVNKYFYLRGGCERYMFEICRLLEQENHELLHLSMTNSRNAPSPYSEHFIPEVDYRKSASFLQRVSDAGKVIWNQEAYDRVSELVSRYRPDVAHLHNIAHQLSGSVVAALAHAGVPILQTLHDYKLVCPAYRLFRDGRPCDSCYKHRYWEPVRHKCLLDNRAASLVAALEATVCSVTGLYRKGINLYHSPSLFLKRTMEHWGVDGNRIVHYPYTINLAEYEPGYDDDGFFLFAGRLSHEKGLATLLDAAAALPDIPIVIAGEGPEREQREREAENRSIRSIRFAGHLSGTELKQAMCRSRALLLPSEYDDNSPLVIYEAFAFGKPVIGSRRGGIPEMVRAGETGLLFPSGDGEALAEAIRKLSTDPSHAKEMGKTARERMEREYGPRVHLSKLMESYKRAADL